MDRPLHVGGAEGRERGLLGLEEAVWRRIRIRVDVVVVLAPVDLLAPRVQLGAREAQGHGHVARHLDLGRVVA